MTNLTDEQSSSVLWYWTGTKCRRMIIGNTASGKTNIQPLIERTEIVTKFSAKLSNILSDFYGGR